MAISTAGIGSGLDVNGIVSSLMAVERRPLNLINTQRSAVQARLSAFGSMSSALTTFQTAVTSLASASRFNAQTVSSSSPEVFTATANGTATLGDYAVTVNQLAQSQKIAMAGMSSPTAVVGTGTLTIAFGRFAPALETPPTPASFTAHPDKVDLIININPANNTLAGVRDAINAANASVSATIINDGSQHRLVITSRDTGEVNSLKITVDDADGDSEDTQGLSRLAFDPMATVGEGKNMTELQTPRNAMLTIDGIAVVKPSNTVSDAIAGVTLNLLRTSDATAVNLAVATDSQQIQGAVREFVEAFNRVNTSMRSLTRAGTEGTSAGRLAGDATARTVLAQIRAVVTQAVDTGGPIQTLADIGVTLGRTGELVLDNNRLNTAMTNHFSEIAKLFASSARATDPQITFVSGTRDTQSGTFAVNISQLASQDAGVVGSFNGVAGLGFGATLIGAAGEPSAGLRIKVGGSNVGDRGTVTFTNGLATQLEQVLGRFLATDGILAARTEGMNNSVRRLDQQTEAVNIRLAAVERRFREQFTRLDSLLANMQGTNAFLTQQISAIGNLNRR